MIKCLEYLNFVIKCFLRFLRAIFRALNFTAHALAVHAGLLLLPRHLFKSEALRILALQTFLQDFVHFFLDGLIGVPLLLLRTVVIIGCVHFHMF